LLHEGAGSAAVNAFVEVVFDNSDNRFSLENSDEVVLRRTIGPKKDEFFLQRKRATKQEISSLLEGAGFSKSNPYFMVQQGKIQDICTMRDNNRLALLKQVAGTTVYDEKKQESLAKMEENLSSIDKISQILSDIEQRLQELHGEKEELTHYQQLDRKRRAMEYTLYDKELRRARKFLDDLEHERVEHVEMVSQLHEDAKATHDAIRNVEAVLKTKSNALKRNRKTLKALEEDKTSAVTHHAALKLECDELQESIKAAESQEKSNKKELKKLEREIARAQSELHEQVQPQYDEASQALRQMTHELDQNKKEAEGLHAKQGRGSHFQSKRERDEYLQSNIQEMNDSKAEREATIAEHREKLASLRRNAAKDAQDLEAQEALISEKTETQQSFSKTIDAKKRQRLETLERRQQQWRSTEDLNEQLREAKEAMNKALSDARKVMPRATALGLEALDRIVKQEKLTVGQQYFGMLMDNISLKHPKFQTAVEVAAQNSLFHVIVDSDATAAHLMKRLEDGKLGRVTFLPLNRLRVDHVEYPQNVPEIQPMLELCLQYEPAVKRAVEHVFSRKLLARSVEEASEWSSKLNMDAITLEGDLSGRKGALTGGYVDSNKSRLQAHRNQKEAVTAFHDAERAHHESQQQAQTVDQEYANAQQELQRLEAKHTEMQRTLKDLNRDADKKRTRIEKNNKQAEKIEQKIPPLELEISGIDADILRLQDEMKTELTTTLSDEEKQLLVDLKETEKKLKTDIEKQTDMVSKIGVKRQRLQSLLEDNLMKRKQELQGLSAATIDDFDEDEEEFSGRSATLAAKIARQQGELEEKRHELEVAARGLHGIEERLAEARKVEQDICAELVATKGQLEKLKGQDSTTKKALEEAQDKSERMLNKVSFRSSKGREQRSATNSWFAIFVFSSRGLCASPSARLTQPRFRS
jgi:structural maintenance of chromosome 3 (chondroitin sulfate proteoglycan 6)